MGTGVKQPGREVDHSPPSSAEVKKSTAIPPLPYVWYLISTRDNLTLPFVSNLSLSQISVFFSDGLDFSKRPLVLLNHVISWKDSAVILVVCFLLFTFSKFGGIIIIARKITHYHILLNITELTHFFLNRAGIDNISEYVVMFPQKFFYCLMCLVNLSYWQQ
jgi:hypothetical protein